MDLCLNITDQSPVKKREERTDKNNRYKLKAIQNVSDTIDLTLEKKTKVKPAFVKKKFLKNVSKTRDIFNANDKVNKANDTFNFAWNTNKNIKAAFFKKKLQNGVVKFTAKDNERNQSNEIQNEPQKNNTIPNRKSIPQKKQVKVKKVSFKDNLILPDNENKKKSKDNSVTEISDDRSDSDFEIVKNDNCVNNTSPKNGGKLMKGKKFHLFNNFSNVSNIKVHENVKVNPATEHMFSDSKTFKDINIHPHTVTNLERIGLKILTVVQEKAIPEILLGKNVFIRSQTGSGKTLAYAIPIVESLQRVTPHFTRKVGVQAMVVVPTRELALQTYELFLKLVEPFRWIVPGRLCGGEKRSSEKARLRKGITILIGTPGRLLDHVLHTGNLKLNKIRCVVLDEADRLLDMGFQKDINRLIEKIDETQTNFYDPIALLKSNKSPVENTKPITNNRQTVLLSATLTSHIEDLARFTMTDYVYIDPLTDSTSIKDKTTLSISKEIAIPQSVKQKYVITDVKARLTVLSAYTVEKMSRANCKMLVFMASKQMVEFHELLFKKCLLKIRKKKPKSDVIILSDDEEEDDDTSDALEVQFFKLHGSMEQRERVEVFKNFRKADKGVLLCTDVASRGLDIPSADYVVQYTGPLQDEDYIHRVGRTGRAGHYGCAIIFLTETELEYLAHLQQMNYHLTRVKQEKLLQSLVSFMKHVSPQRPEQVAEMLQRNYEEAVLEDNELQKAACLAYSSWARYYSSYPASQKKFFNFHKVHLGHYVTSFALRKTPHEVAQYVRTKRDVIAAKRLNKKLANHEIEENSVNFMPKIKKRKRADELVLSEYDSGLTVAKKKKKTA